MRILRHLLPAPGTVVFVVLIIAGLLWAQSVGAITLGAPAAASPYPSTIPYQGRIANVAGAPLTGLYPMAFRLYGAAAGGSPLWEEQWTGPNSVAVSDGLFNVMLGSLNPIAPAIVAGTDSLFLGITVGTDDEMTPRVQVGTVPYAIQALSVPDASIDATKLADGAVTADKLADGISFAPPGAILMWSGPLSAIPAGWALCDGANGTPDLRDRFILSVASGENPGATGGAASVTPSGAISGGAHSHTGRTATIGSGGDDGGRVDGGGYPIYQSHTHAFTTDPATPQLTFTGQPMDNRPQFFKLAFIMKL